jgi:hypothetical protein
LSERGYIDSKNEERVFIGSWQSKLAVGSWQFWVMFGVLVSFGFGFVACFKSSAKSGRNTRVLTTMNTMANNTLKPWLVCWLSGSGYWILDINSIP